MINQVNFTSKSYNNFNSGYEGTEPISPSFLERQPKNDTVNISKSPAAKTKKAVYLFGGLATLALGTVFAVKKANGTYLKRAQKMFQEVFMQDNITQSQTKEILKRYKNINNLKRDEDFLEALFNEAKRNFGFENSKIKFELIEGKRSAVGQTMGGAQWGKGIIQITPGQSRTKLINTIHHEFRHLKQHQVAMQYDAKECMRARMTNPQIQEIYKEFGIKGGFDEAVAQSSIDDALEIFGMNRFSRNDLPKKYHDYAKKIISAEKEYANAHSDFISYHKNFTEVDARKAGDGMQGLLNKIPDID